MALFRKKAATAQQKAQRAQMRIFIRFACCAYLIYFVIVPLFKPPAEGDSMSPTIRIVAIVAFIAATAAILIFATKELVVNWKAGMYKADAYEDDSDEEADDKDSALGAIGAGDRNSRDADGSEPDDGNDDDNEDNDEYNEDDEYEDDDDDEYEYEDDEDEDGDDKCEDNDGDKGNRTD